MAQKTVTPLVLNNGVYLQSNEYETTAHLDKAHVTYLNRSNGPVEDLGIIQPFVTAGYKMTPYLYNFSKQGKSRKYLDGHIYKWSTPLHEEPCYIMEDLSQTDKPGFAGEKFKIKVNSNKYNNGYIIAIDQHDPHQLLITEDEIIQDGDGWILTVKLMSVDQADRWFPKSYLRRNTKYFAITTMETEFSQTYSDIPSMGGGMRDYFNTIGQTRAQLHYSVTRDAAYSKIHKTITSSLADYRKIIEMYIFKPGTLGYDLSMKGQSPHSVKGTYAKHYGAKGGAKMDYDIVMRSWVPEIELTGMAWLDAMVEQEAMWGSGGLVDYDGRAKRQRSLGLFPQLNMGNTHTYNLFNFTLEKFEFIIASRVQGRTMEDGTQEYVIKTGKGGLSMVKNWLRNKPGALGMITNSDAYIQGLGKNNNKNLTLHVPEFTGWSMANGMGTIRFELAPALDPIDANPQVNPKVPASKGIGGYRLSSYMFIIDDISNSAEGNIVELVYGPDWDFTKRSISGKMDYMGKQNFRSASHHPGFEVFMEKRHKGYWVKDVTKSLLIKPINPNTGRPLYSSYFLNS